MKNSSFFLIIFIQIFFWGCSNTVPDLTNVDACVIYEYNSIQESPSQKLSVFVQSSPDTARVQSIKVLHPEEEIQWEITNPLFLDNGSKFWAGSANLMPPYYGSIPQGRYTVVYTDLAGEQATSSFILEYKQVSNLSLDQPIFNDTSENDTTTSQDDSNSRLSKKIAIYSEANGMGSLLYFDKMKEDWNSFDDIIKTYDEAKSLRLCIDFPNNQVRYLLPFHNFN